MVSYQFRYAVQDEVAGYHCNVIFLYHVKYHKAFVYLWEYSSSSVCVNQLKGTSPVYWMHNENRFLSLTAFTKATNLVVSLISYSYLIWKFNCYLNITIIALNWTIRLIPTSGITNYPTKAYPTCNDTVNGQTGSLGFYCEIRVWLYIRSLFLLSLSFLQS